AESLLMGLVEIVKIAEMIATEVVAAIVEKAKTGQTMDEMIVVAQRGLSRDRFAELMLEIALIARHSFAQTPVVGGFLPEKKPDFHRYLLKLQHYTDHNFYNILHLEEVAFHNAGNAVILYH
ncbi:MAG: hypothetical protein M3Z24_10190, partial [Chloroflexota bacterium]|nr:hypothetical protein [Chloroflexota bacterium]